MSSEWKRCVRMDQNIPLELLIRLVLVVPWILFLSGLSLKYAVQNLWDKVTARHREKE